jgi:hypothetical protein
MSRAVDATSEDQSLRQAGVFVDEVICPYLVGLLFCSTVVPKWSPGGEMSLPSLARF